MPRLGRSQKDAKEAQRTAIMAKRAADLQAGVGTSKSSSPSSKAPPPPMPNALSTNQQPIKAGAKGKRLSSSNAANAATAAEQRPTADDRSPSAVAALSSRSKSQRKEASSSAVPASPSPAAAAEDSDMSTSGESDLELETGAANNGGGGSISIVDEHADGDEEDELGGGGVGDTSNADEASPEVKCMWEDCGKVFGDLASFINHLHDEHVGIHKARYACEWTGCPRKGKGQTSRFALLSHLRSHTGEKPFTCPRPECDKSFTRSDALAKHMRVQHNINPVTSRGRNAARMREEAAAAAAAAEDDEWGLGGGSGERGETAGGTRSGGGAGLGADAVGDELLELAEGEANGSLADIEQSLMMRDSKSPYFTYDNLFGAGARALAQLGAATTGKKGSSSSNEAPAYGAGPIPDADLGIVRDHEYSVGLAARSEARDEEAIARQDSEMARVLEAGRRRWVVRERQRSELRPDIELPASVLKRAQIDYLSDDEAADGSVADGSLIKGSSHKRARRSSTRNLQKQAQSIDNVTNLKRLYLVEKAKLRFIRRENVRMNHVLYNVRQLERQEMEEKRVLLERTLEAELGKDVSAIFSPPPSPSLPSSPLPRLEDV